MLLIHDVHRRVARFYIYNALFLEQTFSVVSHHQDVESWLNTVHTIRGRLLETHIDFFMLVWALRRRIDDFRYSTVLST